MFSLNCRNVRQISLLWEQNMNNCTNHDKFRSCKAHFSTGSALGSASMLLQSLSNNSSPNIDEKNPGMAFILLLYCCHVRLACTSNIRRFKISRLASFRIFRMPTTHVEPCRLRRCRNGASKSGRSFVRRHLPSLRGRRRVERYVTVRHGFLCPQTRSLWCPLGSQRSIRRKSEIY